MPYHQIRCPKCGASRIEARGRTGGVIIVDCKKCGALGQLANADYQVQPPVETQTPKLQTRNANS